MEDRRQEMYSLLMELLVSRSCQNLSLQEKMSMQKRFYCELIARVGLQGLHKKFLKNWIKLRTRENQL